MNSEIIFTERQRFRQLWLWIPLLCTCGLLIYRLLTRENESFFGMGLLLLVTILFIISMLDTKITKDGIYVRFFPFHLTYRKYLWDSISKVFVKQYKPIMDYGGWGFRLGLFGKGMAFNISGNKGIQIVFTNGRRLLIGTNKPDEAKEALKKVGRLTE